MSAPRQSSMDQTLPVEHTRNDEIGRQVYLPGSVQTLSKSASDQHEMAPQTHISDKDPQTMVTVARECTNSNSSMTSLLVSVLSTVGILTTPKAHNGVKDKRGPRSQPTIDHRSVAKGKEITRDSEVENDEKPDDGSVQRAFKSHDRYLEANMTADNKHLGHLITPVAPEKSAISREEKTASNTKKGEFPRGRSMMGRGSSRCCPCIAF